MFGREIGLDRREREREKGKGTIHTYIQEKKKKKKKTAGGSVCLFVWAGEVLQLFSGLGRKEGKTQKNLEVLKT